MTKSSKRNVTSAVAITGDQPNYCTSNIFFSIFGKSTFEADVCWM